MHKGRTGDRSAGSLSVNRGFLGSVLTASLSDDTDGRVTHGETPGSAHKMAGHSASQGNHEEDCSSTLETNTYICGKSGGDFDVPWDEM